MVNPGEVCIYNSDDKVILIEKINNIKKEIKKYCMVNKCPCFVV
ncbi:hypothetical protein [Clostridium collagenovorans]|nr:hypothetical protein [Clostridium collagenovorans]